MSKIEQGDLVTWRSQKFDEVGVAITKKYEHNHCGCIVLWPHRLQPAWVPSNQLKIYSKRK